MLFCKYCNKEFKNAGGKATHEPYCKDNPDKIIREKSPNAHRKKGSIPWNKGLVGDERCKKSEETKLKLSLVCDGKAKTVEKEIERLKKIKEKSVNNGGYRKGSGRGIKGWYKGIFCDSSWELAFVLYCERWNIPIKRNMDRFPYSFEGKLYNYIPDFIVEEEYVEIKGFLTEKNQAKIDQFPHKLKLMLESDMKPILEEIIKLYGKNFVELYENMENTEVGSSHCLENSSNT